MQTRNPLLPTAMALLGWVGMALPVIISTALREPEPRGFDEISAKPFILVIGWAGTELCLLVFDLFRKKTRTDSTIWAVLALAWVASALFRDNGFFIVILLTILV